MGSEQNQELTSSARLSAMEPASLAEDWTEIMIRERSARNHPAGVTTPLGRTTQAMSLDCVHKVHSLHWLGTQLGLAEENQTIRLGTGRRHWQGLPGSR